LTGKDVTQFLRGRLFVNVDFVMSSNTYTEENLKLVIQFLNAAIELVVAWLKYVPTVFKKTMSELRVDKDLYLVDEDIAIVQSVTEVMGVLRRIFCGCHRAIRLFMYYDINQQERQENSISRDYTNQDFIKRRSSEKNDYDIDEVKNQIYSKNNMLIFGQALNFVDHFH